MFTCSYSVRERWSGLSKAADTWTPPRHHQGVGRILGRLLRLAYRGPPAVRSAPTAQRERESSTPPLENRALPPPVRV